MLTCQHHISWVRQVAGGLHQCILCTQVVTKKDVYPKLEDLPEEFRRRWDAHEATRVVADAAPSPQPSPPARAGGEGEKSATAPSPRGHPPAHAEEEESAPAPTTTPRATPAASAPAREPSPAAHVAADADHLGG